MDLIVTLMMTIIYLIKGINNNIEELDKMKVKNAIMLIVISMIVYLVKAIKLKVTEDGI